MKASENGAVVIEMVHQKVGRNLFLFQKLEYTLKMIVSMSEISGYSSDLEANKERRKAWAMKQTLGQIVGEHIESFNPVEERVPKPSPIRNEPYFSIRLTTQCEDNYLDQRKSVLAGLVKERNELAHHLLATYKLDNEASRKQLISMLDNQYQRLVEEVDLSFDHGKSQFKICKEFAAWLQTEEGHKFLVWEIGGGKEA
jgi:hypothetical protein